MGRPRDKRGKDRPRTIVLAGDVADIAQKLADDSKLSSTLSELLRAKFGYGSKIEHKKAELDDIYHQKTLLATLEEEKIAEIEALEAEVLTQLPDLLEKVRILRSTESRIAALMDQSPHMRSTRQMSLDNVRQKIADIESKIGDLQ